MYDLKLNEDWDIDVSEDGDISTTSSVRQEVKLRLQWIFNEWRLGPELGLTYFEDILVKKPNLEKIRSLIRKEILKADSVESATVTLESYDSKTRTVTYKYTVYTSEEVFEDGVSLDV